MEEREIDLLDMIADILSHWRGLLVALIIGAVLMGGFSYVKSYRNIQSTPTVEEEPELDELAVEEQLTQLEDSLSDSEKAAVLTTVDDEREYLYKDKYFQESVYMKNPFFREESEIRLCEFSPKQFLMGREVELSLGARLYNYSYYVKESQLISYVDFDFSDCLDRLIKELVIGPKCLMSERDMEYYLTTLGLSNCRVKKSQGTYR